MKKHITPHRRAFVALGPIMLTPVLLMAAPALSQGAQTVTPPVVVPTVTAPAPQQSAPPAPVSRGQIGDPNSATPIAPEAVAQIEAEAVERRAARPAPRPPAARAAARPATTSRASAPVAVAPVAEAPAPVAPIEAAPPPVAAAPITPAPDVAAPADTVEAPATNDSAPIWPWLIAALAVIAGVIGVIVFRRRRAAAYDDYYEEEYVAEPAVIRDAEVAPIAADPAPFAPAEEPQFLRAAPVAMAADDDMPAIGATGAATLNAAEESDVASLTSGDAPIANRPWLEFAMRPVRAGTNAEEATVEIELTVGNSGTTAAKDVRISTFMFAAEPGTEMDRLLTERASGAPTVTIEPGEGTRVDATMVLPASGFAADADKSFVPIIVADARYLLPGGKEGHTRAAFQIGISEEGRPQMLPISFDDPGMHDDVEVRLHGVPEHA